MSSRTCLYLDDCRTPTQQLPGYEPWVIVRSYNEFTDYIINNGIPDLISFDHDLADEHSNDYFDQVAKIGFQSPDYNSYKEKTGLDCAKFICDLYQYNPIIKFPRCIVHSHNPVGCSNILGYINGFIKHMEIDEFCYEQRFPFIMETKIE